MKNLTVLSLSFLLLIISCQDTSKKTTETTQKPNTKNTIEKPEVKSGTFFVDIQNSNIEWLGEKPTGSHNGNILIKKGVIEIDENGNISAGKFMLDMQSITCADLADKPKKKESLENHLKDDDFFDTESYPTAMFAINRTDNNTMSGVLTIKGISQEIDFNYTQNEKLTYQAEIVVNRTLFDIKYKSKSIFPDLGDHFINDNFTITLNPIVFK